MRIALLGAGTIARLVLEHVARGALEGIEIVGIAGRSPASSGKALAGAHSVPYVVGRSALLALRPQIVVEAASHDAVREHLVALLDAGAGVVVLSAGALAEDSLRESAEQAARRSGALLCVPSGGIGGLDALKAACVAGVEEVSIRVAKPPRAWKGIPYVEALGVDLERLGEARTLFKGSAREGVPHFPQNVNIAAVLSLAGIGFDRTQLEVVADPALTRNTHTICVTGVTGRFSIVLENVPSPDNPKTAWLACYSALAALRALAAPTRYGT
ncbi:MAG: aspartate dehydrogenase [Betaproteobacteria bacterium]|nr:aspartate dehydrogenase [Betaproteobacteria bacterium]MDH5352718.1 aspartate dehydrogenase [Betaproteobacteria bacterium]